MITTLHSSSLSKLESIISYKLPVPANISNLWNFGSCLGLFLAMQIITGLLLASHYTADTNLAFDSIISLSRDTSWGGMLRVIHLNGASMYFLFLYIHIGRGLYYASYSYTMTWLSGFFIFILSMMVAFLGYVLPWGQMSYWGATVITNLISAIPVVGPDIVFWVWGGFSISNATLMRFFAIHFCVPIFMASFVGLHVFFLHKTGSQNPSNILSKYNILSFQPFFVAKDVMFFFIVFLIFEVFIFLNPYLVGDPENFSMANMMSTPEHIVPEWYFLFAYAILRCIPSKGLGVIGMLTSVSIILLPMFIVSQKSLTFRSSKGFSSLLQLSLWMFLIIIIMLTWLGGQTVSAPFVSISQLMFLYFMKVIFILFTSMYYSSLMMSSSIWTPTLYIYAKLRRSIWDKFSFISMSLSLLLFLLYKVFSSQSLLTFCILFELLLIPVMVTYFLESLYKKKFYSKCIPPFTTLSHFTKFKHKV